VFEAPDFDWSQARQIGSLQMEDCDCLRMSGTTILATTSNGNQTIFRVAPTEPPPQKWHCRCVSEGTNCSAEDVFSFETDTLQDALVVAEKSPKKITLVRRYQL